MKKLLANLKLVTPFYLLFIILVCLVGIWSIYNLPFTPTFPYYTDLSSRYSRELSSFAHFDGIHYLRIIHKGYDDTGSQAFFPVYPLLIRTLSLGVFDPLYLAIVINVLCLFIALMVIVSQLTKTHAKRFLLLFFSFPASFFLLGVYTESLFILLVALFFHFLKQQKYLLSAFIAGIAAGTRLVGVFLSLSLLIELLRHRQPLSRSFFYLLISLGGLIGYLYYLFIRFGDPLMFIHVQPLFGGGRSDGTLVLLPQVIYRYIKILVTATPTTILYLRSCIELLTFSLSLYMLYLYRRRLTLSTLIFCVFAILLPTLSGTLSSFPRYLMTTIPLFIVAAKNIPARVLWITVCLQCGILTAALALFIQGIFVA